MKSRKWMQPFYIGLIALIFLTGCDHRPHTQRYVQRYVERYLPGSALMEVSDDVQKDSEDVKSVVVYKFKSPQGVEFQVKTFLSRSIIFQTMQRRLENDYTEQLLIFKEDSLKDTLQKHGFLQEDEGEEKTSPLNIPLQDFSEIKDAPALIMEMYQGFRPFLPLPEKDQRFRITVSSATSPHSFVQFPIQEQYNTLYTEEFFRRIIETKYIYAVAEGEFSDNLVSEEIVRSVPEESLEFIMMNHEDEVFVVKDDMIVYDLVDEEYIMPIYRKTPENKGLNSVVELQREVVSECYPDANYIFDEDTSTITYTIHGNSYEIHFEEGSKAEFRKNGKVLDIRLKRNPYWLRTAEEETSFYSIRLEDFARLVEMEIDKVSLNTVYFTVK